MAGATAWLPLGSGGGAEEKQRTVKLKEMMLCRRGTGEIRRLSGWDTALFYEVVPFFFFFFFLAP